MDWPVDVLHLTNAEFRIAIKARRSISTIYFLSRAAGIIFRVSFDGHNSLVGIGIVTFRLIRFSPQNRSQQWNHLLAGIPANKISRSLETALTSLPNREFPIEAFVPISTHLEIVWTEGKSHRRNMVLLGQELYEYGITSSLNLQTCPLETTQTQLILSSFYLFPRVLLALMWFLSCDDHGFMLLNIANTMESRNAESKKTTYL